MALGHVPELAMAATVGSKETVVRDNGEHSPSEIAIIHKETTLTQDSTTSKVVA